LVGPTKFPRLFGRPRQAPLERRDAAARRYERCPDDAAGDRNHAPHHLRTCYYTTGLLQHRGVRSVPATPGGDQQDRACGAVLR
jgi:transposase